MTGFAWHRSWAISRPALADSGPSIVLFAVLALAPETPLAAHDKPNVPPEVGAALCIKLGWMTRLRRATRWLAAMLHGDWAFSFVSRVNEQQLPARPRRCWVGILNGGKGA